MKIVLRAPCRECPFLKKAIKGWLGEDTPEQVWAKVHADTPFGYPCHMDVDEVSESRGEDETWREDPDSVEQCTGALLHAAKTSKSYSDRFREAARQALKAIIGLDGILGMEFMKHHKERP